MGAGGSEQADDNLAKVDHVVVMMLENRSFDHMLGYLSLTGGRPDIDGLRPGFANSYQGRSYPVHHLKTMAVELDPDHSSAAIDRQIAGGSMGGFVASAAATLAERRDDDGDPGCVMGYYDGADVPVYDHWFSSVAGATLPNRLYALCGVAAGSRDDRPLHVPPLYHQPSFVRHLDAAGVPWRWYSFDQGRCASPTPATGSGTTTGSAFSSKTELSVAGRSRPHLQPEATQLPGLRRGGHAAGGVLYQAGVHQLQPARLPRSTTTTRGPTSQTARISCSPPTTRWPRAPCRTVALLVIVYDENGSFYDHVPPPDSRRR